jgi:F420-0:gamma-glutamyl ligase-like protein
MKRLLSFLCSLIPACGYMDKSGYPHQMGGQLAVERWPDGHYKYVGDFNQSFQAATDAIKSLVTSLGLAYIAGDIAKAREITSQLASKGVTQTQLAKINADAAANAALVNAKAGTINNAIKAAPDKVQNITVPTL